MTKPKLWFTHVMVQAPGGGWNYMTADEFNSIPSVERIELIREDKVEFLKDGDLVRKTKK